jgi:hypothetical protein
MAPHRRDKLGALVDMSLKDAGNIAASFGRPSLAGRINSYVWTGLAYLIAVFFMSGQMMVNANGNFTFLRGNQNFCNFTSNFTSVAMTAPVVNVNLQWLLLSIQLTAAVVFWLFAIIYLREYLSTSVVTKGYQGWKLWKGFAIADHVGLIVDCVVWGAIAFTLNNLLGDKDWYANVSAWIITDFFLCSLYLSEYFANVSYAAYLREMVLGLPLQMGDTVPDNFLVLPLVINAMVVLGFSWIITSLVVPLMNMYGQNISLPQGTLFAFGAFISYLIYRMLTTFVMELFIFAGVSAGEVKVGDEETGVQLLNKDKSAKVVVYGWGSFFIISFVTLRNMISYVIAMIAIYGIADQFPTNYIRYA